MTQIAFDRFILDPKRRVLWADGQPVDLQARPFDILAFLVAAGDRVVSRDEIMAQVWQGQIVAESNLTVQMSMLRRALADCGASGLILTLPSRGYRFVADVTECAPATALGPAAEVTRTVQAVQQAAVPRRRPLAALLLGALALCLCGATLWRYLGIRSDLALPDLVKVEVDPDEVEIDPGGVRPVDYLFTVESPGDLQLDTEDVQYYLTTGQPVGRGNVRGRIWRGSFPIRGGTTGVYHNHIYLPPDVAAVGKARGAGVVQLKHLFHLRDTRGNEVSVPAVLRVLVGP